MTFKRRLIITNILMVLIPALILVLLAAILLTGISLKRENDALPDISADIVQVDRDALHREMRPGGGIFFVMVVWGTSAVVLTGISFAAGMGYISHKLLAPLLSQQIDYALYDGKFVRSIAVPRGRDCTAEDIARSFTGGDLAAHVYAFLFSDEISPCVLERGGTVVDFYARYAENATKFATLSEAQCYFYQMKRRKNVLEATRRRLTSALSQASKKQEKRLAQIAEKKRQASDAETLRQKGELITANLWALARGMKSCELVNYYDEAGGTVRIALDERLTPSQNAQAYFKRYQKQKRTLEALAPQERETRAELAYLESLSPLVASSDSADDLAALEEELVGAGLVKPQQTERRGAKKPEVPFRAYEREGFAVCAGRSNLQNDRLVRMSAPDDLWLHARGLHSAHVVIRTNGKQPPESVVAFAAAVCAKYSAGKGEKIPVDVCEIKYVRRIKGAKAGLVTYTDFTTVLGDPALADEK